MKTTQMPQTDHVAFDAMCEQLEEFEPLPAVQSATPEFAAESDAEIDEQAAPIDSLILAGLVSP